jgi:truncated hemoglobin YjbI
MPFYELITEPGNNSIMECENDEEALQAAQNHHLRALNGVEGGPTGHPSERVVKLLRYERHPADMVINQADQVEAELADAVKTLKADGEINVEELAAAVRSIANPLVADKERQGSMYKMAEEQDIWKEPK